MRYACAERLCEPWRRAQYCFEDQEFLDRFKTCKFTLDAQATAVAQESGAGENPNCTEGVSLVISDESDLILEVAIGGFKFSYQVL
jgi:hypothetical protein